MKRYLVLLDFDGTLIERDQNGCRHKIKFADLIQAKSVYKAIFSIEIDYKILTSSCAQSIEDIMTVSEMASVGEWLFENGLHIRKYGEFSDKVHTDEHTQAFQAILPAILDKINLYQKQTFVDSLESISTKKSSFALHIRHSLTEIYEDLLKTFGTECTIVKSGLQTIEIFPRNRDKVWALEQIDLSTYERVVFIGDSIYPGGNDYSVAHSHHVDFSIEVKSPRDSAKLLANMQEISQKTPFHSSILNGSQARVVTDRNKTLSDKRFFDGKKFILLDFDGTLTYEKGQVFPKILDVLKILSETYKIWIITGRSLGWADMMINTFPIDGVIGENGAFAFYWDQMKRKINFWQSQHIHADYKQRLAHLKTQIQSEFPYITFASDQFSREHDIAAVINEHGETVSDEQIEKLLFWARTQGAYAAVSNIHVNIWFGDYNKAQSVIEVFNEIYSVCNFELCRRSFYIGDSPNDEPMFRLIDASFGVKNLEMFLSRLRYKPAAISDESEAYGSYDILKKILEKEQIELYRQA